MGKGRDLRQSTRDACAKLFYKELLITSKPLVCYMMTVLDFNTLENKSKSR